ncbi:hypothetical protein F5B21DRAFT_508912 [Xylaria acuta]|nr:hypothetical protein F5B21DRAFT_508912 [Xylaria acuta]
MRWLHLEEAEMIDQCILREVEILRAIAVNDTADIQLSLRNRSDDAVDAANWKEFHIYSATVEDEWVEHCKGFVPVKAGSRVFPPGSLDYPAEFLENL